MARTASGPLRVLLVWVLLELAAAAQVPAERGVLLVEWFRAVLGPVAGAAELVLKGVEDLGSGFRDMARLIAERQELRLKLERAEAQRTALAAEVARLRSALPLVPSSRRAPGGGRVAGCRSYDAARGLLQVEGGLADGLRPDQPVLAAGGLVGRVWRVGSRTSWVELLTGPVASVAVTTRDGSVHGLARGSGGGGLSVLYVPRSAQLLVGTELVTSGADGVYPAGLPVARVTLVRESGGPFLEVRARPVVEPGRLRTVLVLTGESP